MGALKNLVAAAAVGMMAFAGAASAQDKGLIGISMPTKSSARWISDGASMVKVFQEKGYKTDLQYAEDDIPNQLAQIENMITKKVKVLVIAAIDGTTLTAALKQAFAHSMVNDKGWVQTLSWSSGSRVLASKAS